MISNVTHEFRTPLNAIIASSDINRHLLTELTPHLQNRESEQIMDRLRQMNHACKTSSQLLLYFINDILDLGRIDNEAFRITIQEF
jgi:signal transduction histidine kinase